MIVLPVELKPFKPYVFANKEEDTLTYMERDCSVMEKQMVGRSPLIVFYDNQTGEIVGFRIENISHLSPF